MLLKVESYNNFKGIFYNPCKEVFNDEQIQVAEDIISKLKTVDETDKQKRTFEEKYKKSGYDFVISPNDRFFDSRSVLLHGVSNKDFFSENEDDIISRYNHVFHIGTYDYTTPFDIDHTEEMIEDDKFQRQTGIGLALLIPILAGIMAFVGTFNDKKVPLPKQINKTLVDTINHSKNDTVKLVKNLNVRI